MSKQAMQQEPVLVQVRLRPHKSWQIPTPTKDEPTALARAKYLVRCWPDRYEMRLLYAAIPQPLTPVQIDKAARTLAAAMDYPWEHMPEKGRDEMRKHARAVIAAANN